MSVFTFPRSRGGDSRGPQIGDSTFEARVAQGVLKPKEATAFAWSPGGSFPDIELWCFHKDKHDAVGPARETMWLDRVDGGFVPPVGGAPTDAQTIVAFRNFARDRHLTWGQSSLSNWEVRIARPFPSEANATPFRKVGQVDASEIYEILQKEASLPSQPVAWVWVRSNGARETWLYHLADQQGGFRVPGNVSAGQSAPLTSTELEFELLEPAFVPEAIGHAEQIAEFIDYVLTFGHGQVAAESDLTLHDQRVSIAL